MASEQSRGGRPTLRMDLQWVCRVIRGQERWIARDPLTTEFYYFSAREYRLLRRIDGSKSVAEWISEEIPEDSSTPDWRRKLIERAIRFDLVLPGIPGAARAMRARISNERSRARRFSALQLLAIKLPLFDPTPLLTPLAALGRAIFFKTSLGLLLCAAILLIAILVGRWELVMTRLPTLQTILSGDRVIWMLVAYVIMKIIHELSHALACRRWGAECHELGVFFLAFTPCLYCDVSDVWKLPSKTARVMVSAAGIFAEMAVAIAAGWCWFLTTDGLVNYLAFNLMILGSVSTILVNANPLLRYDGYYILTDLIEVPNLNEQSREAIFSPLMVWLTGGKLVSTPRDASWLLLFCFGIASFVYRMFVLALILWGLNQLLRNWGMELFAGILTLSILSGIVLSLVMRTRASAKEIKQAGPVLWPRFALLTGALTALLYVIFQVPLENSITAVGYTVPIKAEPVFVKRAGFLTTCLPAGTTVREGQSIAKFIANEERLQVTTIEGEIAELEVEIAGLDMRIADASQAATRFAELNELLERRRQQLQSARQELAELTVLANSPGVLFEPSWDPNTEVLDANQANGNLVSWQGNPLDATSLGGWFEQGTLLGWVVDPNRWRVEVFVSESDVLQIASSAAATVQLDRHPYMLLGGRIISIDKQPLVDVPQVLNTDRRLQTLVQHNGQRRTEETTYRVIVELQQQQFAASFKSLATVRIKTRPKTIADRIWRYVQRTFRSGAIY